MNLLQRLLGSRGEQRYSIDDYLQDAYFSYQGNQYPMVGYASTAGRDVEEIGNSFSGYVHSAYKSNGVVFACLLARMLVFSEARFKFRRLSNQTGTPQDLFGNPDLRILERPWPNGTTGELLARMEQDTSLAGNFYVAREQNRLRRLRPDWVSIVLSAPPDEALQSDVEGYMYRPGGMLSDAEPKFYLPDELTHWSPIPDPDAQYRGMSLLTPVIQEIQSDKAATKHKAKFFENGATPQVIVTVKDSLTPQQFKEFVEISEAAHRGTDNAYKTWYLGGGSDAKAVGADLQQLDFKATQGAGETRIAAALRVHPVIAGLSEGLAGSSLNAGNFSAARRSFADGTMRPHWRSACAALSNIVRVPGDAELWYDDRDIAFLREDKKDSAEIERIKALTIRQLIDAGFEADSVVAAVNSEDMSLLRHSGLYSVQLQPPGTIQPDDPEDPTEDDSEDAA